MMGEADVWAVVPIKQTAQAKQRLAAGVPAPLRPGLVLAMLEDVMVALAAVRRLAGILVVTSDRQAAATARRYGARILAGGADGGHTATVAAAARFLVDEDRGGMLQIPGDIPLVTSGEIDRLLAAHRAAPAFTIAPSRDEMGSNAVLVSPPDAVPLRFGDDSFRPHLRAARQCGIEPTVVRLAGIGLDIDRPDDVGAFVLHGAPTHTLAFLRSAGLAGVCAQSKGQPA